MGEHREPVSVHEYLLLDGQGDAASLICARCRARISSVTENYREHSEMRTVPVGALGKLFEGAESTVEEEVVWRTYHCPDCGGQIDGEICPRSAEPLWDLQLARGGDA